MVRSRRGRPRVLAGALDPSEKEFLAMVTEMAHWLGWLVYHTHESRRSTPGFTDLVLVKAGEPAIFAELKVKGRKLTRFQREWVETLREADGVEVYVWYPWQGNAIEARLRGLRD